MAVATVLRRSSGRRSLPGRSWAAGVGSNEIDAFLAVAQRTQGQRSGPAASREALLRRVYLDLIGLAPTPEERAAFLAMTPPDAYEKLVDRLLADPRHAERWARHWMDIWRYSDWAGWNDGKQIRDSQPHIWRWRDWIIESLQADAGYDRMIIDMLAADERAPEDASALRATGFLVRNYKMLCREQWLEDTVKHTSLGVPRTHRRLCQMPRPQDRSNPANGLLRAARDLRTASGPARPRPRPG